MDLVSSARNPVPSGAIAGFIKTFDGVRLRYARWQATIAPERGTVCICQGRTEFIEKYFEVIADLRRRGFAVATFDWRGQGGSERLLDNPAKGHIRTFRDFDRDLEAFMTQAVQPSCKPPYIALGHSMGGHILLRHATLQTPSFERMVLSAPMIDISPQRLGGSHLKARLYAEVYCLLGLGRLYTRGGAGLPLDLGDFEGNELTNDRERFQRTSQIVQENPQLGLGAPTVSWLRAALRSISQLTAPDYPARVRVPTLLFAAGNDTIASTPAIEDFTQRLKLGKHDLIPEAKHEILMETDAVRRRFWAGFDAYLGVEATQIA